jgi:hypothetical protein
MNILQQLCCRKAEEDRLRLGIGLPTTCVSAGLSTSTRKSSVLTDLDFFEMSHYSPIDRSKIGNYQNWNFALSRTLRSVIFQPKFDAEITKAIWSEFLTRVSDWLSE